MISILIKKYTHINSNATVNDADVDEWVGIREENEFTFTANKEIIQSSTEISNDEKG